MASNPVKGKLVCLQIRLNFLSLHVYNVGVLCVKTLFERVIFNLHLYDSY